MRLAVLVARASLTGRSRPGDEASLTIERALAQFGFDVVFLAGTADLEAKLEKALASAGAEDSVLLHVVGELGDGGMLELEDGCSVPIRALVRIVADKARSSLLIAELTHDDAEDPLLAAEYVAEMREALGAPVDGHAALLALGARAVDGQGPLGFTRLVLEVAQRMSGEDERGALISGVVEELRAMPSSLAVAQCFTLVRGSKDFTLAPGAPEMPAFEPLVALADGARVNQEWSQALAGYRAALLVAPEEAAARAALHARVGEVEAALGNATRARRAFERARATCPTHRAALDALIAMATEAEDWKGVVALCRDRVFCLEAPSDKVDELFSIARTMGEKLADMPGAVAELEKARLVDPKNGDVLEALRRSYRVLKRWPKLLEVTGALADLAPSATESAARRFAQARIARERLDDEERALHFLEGALEDDPTHDEALDVLVEVCTKRGEFARLEGTLEVLIGRFEQLGDTDRTRDAERRLAELVATTTSDEDVRDEVEDESGVLELERIVAEAPLHAPTHARLFARHARAERVDRAYLEALALEELGALEAEHATLLERCRPDGLSVKSSIEEGAWQLLRAPGADDVVEALFAAVARAAIAVHVGERRAKKRLVALDPARRQSETSTASIVRSFHWASRVLGVSCPALYVFDEVLGDIAGVPAPHPSTVLGPGVLRGLSTKDLAFLAGRHLAYYRPEHVLLLYFSTVPELTVLLLAGVHHALPAMPMPPAVAPAVAVLSQGLALRMNDEERAALTVAVNRLDARGGKVDLPGWTRSVELTAGRAGLLLSGDLRTAMTRIRAEARGVADVTAEEKRADLVAFCSSRALADLRAQVAVMASTPPPPRASGTMHRLEFPPTAPWTGSVSDYAEVAPPGESAL